MTVGHSILVIAWHLLTDGCDYADLVATTSSAATPTALASEPWPNSRPSATRSPSNPSPPDGGFSFQDEVGGSSPPRPTIRPPTSGNAAQPLGLSRFQLISNQSTGVGAFEQPHGSLTSGFAGH